jgi:hypothetical protein
MIISIVLLGVRHVYRANALKAFSPSACQTVIVAPQVAPLDMGPPGAERCRPGSWSLAPARATMLEVWRRCP